MKFGKMNQRKSFWNLVLLCGLVLTLSTVIWTSRSEGSSHGRDGGGNSGQKCADVASITVNEGMTVTHERTVQLTITFVNQADFYIACEDLNVVKNAKWTDQGTGNCAWQRVTGGPITFVLSEGSGIKTIYFRAVRLRNKGDIASVSICYVEGSDDPATVCVNPS